MSNIDSESKTAAMKIIIDLRTVLNSACLSDEDRSYVCDEVQRIIDFQRAFLGLL